MFSKCIHILQKQPQKDTPVQPGVNKIISYTHIQGGEPTS